MIAGHYATALIAHQRFPKGSLLFFLLVSQSQDLLWFLFHYLGLEETGPTSVFDATVNKLTVTMTYSHHLLPQLFWAGLIFCIGWLLFRSKTIALVAVALLVGHFVLDFFSGHPHYFFGEHTHEVGLGLYKSNVYLAILIEAVFTVVALWFYFRTEANRGIRRTTKNKAIVIGVFVYALIFLVTIATTSVTEWFNLPAIDLGFNTSVPTLILTYLAMIWVLNRYVPQTSETH